MITKGLPPDQNRQKAVLPVIKLDVMGRLDVKTFETVPEEFMPALETVW